MENKLRPVGTEFEIEYPPIIGSNVIETSFIKYRVVAHKIAFRFLEDKEGVLSEVVEAIDIRVEKKGMSYKGKGKNG